jgi:CRP/FNR family transcriptional regulator, cyclic AMP receptor protein
MLSVDKIRGYPLFEGLNEAELARAAKAITRRAFARGAYVYYPGVPGVNAYLVESGIVRIFFSTVSGKEALLNLAGPLEVFSLPTLQDTQLRLVGAAALLPSVFLSMRREEFFELHDSSPQFARNVYLELVVITRKLILHTRMLTTLNLNGRLATLLLRLARKNENQQYVIHMLISQEELAGWVGASRGRLNQAIKQMQGLNFIRVEGQEIVILDYPGLERMSEEQTMEEV